jgi:energy-coupling factor transport system ATP-binding protein
MPVGKKSREGITMSIKLEHLSHIYNEGTPMEAAALKEIDLEIHEGEFIGLIGHTGSGKSTLTQHLNGLLKATSGDLKYNGQSIYGEGFSMKELRSKVGLVFQYPEHQLFEMDVFTDVCFGPKNLGLSREETEDRARKALTMVGMDESFYKKSPFELSGGQKRRAAIAGVLAMEPEVLILDEPTAGLDPKGRDEILDEVAALQKEHHLTVILVSHSMEDVARYVDRIIVMNQGSVRFDGKPKEVFRHYKELEEIGLAAPQVTYIVQSLRAEGFDIPEDVTTIEEAKTEILKLMKENMQERS